MLQNYLSPQAYREFKAEKLRRQAAASSAVAPTDWQDRLLTVYPGYFIPPAWLDVPAEERPSPFSPPHIDLWEWVAAIEPTSDPRPFTAFWARYRGKSTNGEIAAVDLGARQKRFYCWYVSENQNQADKHVLSVRLAMESEKVLKHFPAVGRPRISKTGGQNWRRDLLVTDIGFSVEAIGLDKAIRGGKIESQRPDLIILDDIDGKHDTEAATRKKEETITTSILPAGSSNCAVLFLQNLIHPNSIAHRLSRHPGTEGAADYLAGRIISGPFPAVEGLAYEYRPEGDDDPQPWKITAGRSLWEGFTVEICQAEINREGPAAFELESQHEIDTDNPDALLSRAILDATRTSSHPDLYRVGVGVDPSGGAGQCGIIGAGIAKSGRLEHGYTIADDSTPAGTPSADWAVAALRCYHSLGADFIAVERNFGGDMVANTIRTAELRDAGGNLLLSGRKVHIIEVNASRGKEVRAEPVASLFQLGRAHHVGFYPELEKQWTKWQPGNKPSPDRLDAEVWVLTELMVDDGKTKTARVMGRR